MVRIRQSYKGVRCKGAFGPRSGERGREPRLEGKEGILNQKADVMRCFSEERWLLSVTVEARNYDLSPKLTGER